MFSKVFGIGLSGIDAYEVSVEVDVSDGLPAFVMVGVLAAEVKEAQDRVRTALRNSDFALRSQKVTVNLSPAGVRKSGTAFDLAIAAGVLGAYGLMDCAAFRDAVLLGELGLDGQVRPVRGVLSMVMEAKRCGKKICVVPQDNVREGQMIPGIQIIGIRSVKELPELLKEKTQRSGVGRITRPQENWEAEPETYPVDFKEVQGQLFVRRATEVAVSGRHHILYIGSAGSGKTMIAERIPTILPSGSIEEQLEISRIYSVCGMLSREHPLMRKRPFRSPHHSCSVQALAGGGKYPIPGELSLASGGVLFLDELPEFPRCAIELLREPLESRKIVISRVNGRYEFPADFILAAAMNPCPCGFYPDRNRCHCTDTQIRNYLGKVSKPIRDRIDICVEAAAVSYEELNSRKERESSETIRKRVERVREIQEARFRGTGIHFNGEMSGELIRKFCVLEQGEEEFFRDLYQKRGFSARGYGKVLKVARTIADMEGSELIRHPHLCEAIGYRSLEEKYWNGN